MSDETTAVNTGTEATPAGSAPAENAPAAPAAGDSTTTPPANNEAPPAAAPVGKPAEGAGENLIPQSRFNEILGERDNARAMLHDPRALAQHLQQNPELLRELIGQSPDESGGNPNGQPTGNEPPDPVVDPVGYQKWVVNQAKAEAYAQVEPLIRERRMAEFQKSLDTARTKYPLADDEHIAALLVANPTLGVDAAAKLSHDRAKTVYDKGQTDYQATLAEKKKGAAEPGGAGGTTGNRPPSSLEEAAARAEARLSGT
jgi:hypothetical protein